MTNRHNETWKEVERAIADELEGERVPVSGRGDGPDVVSFKPRLKKGKPPPDVFAGGIAAEVKHRKMLPLWLQKALAQAVKGALPGQLPIVVLHQLNRRHANDYVILRMKDFKEVMNLAGRRKGSPNPDDTG